MTNTIGLFLYGASFAKAVTLKSNSYSAEQALAQLEASSQQFNECLCFRYRDGEAVIDDLFGPIEDGGFIEDTNADGKCVDEVRDFIVDDPLNPGNPAINLLFHHYTTVTNQSCLYKLWMCSCWAS